MGLKYLESCIAIFLYVFAIFNLKVYRLLEIQIFECVYLVNSDKELRFMYKIY